MNNKSTSRITQQRQQSHACNALTLYLDNLAPSGRRSMRSLLQQAALLNKWTGPLEQMPWLTLRYAQVAQIRAALRRTDKAPNTINTTLAALRGVLKAGFLSGQYPALEWQRIQTIPRMPGKPLPAGRRLSASEVKRLLKACENDSSHGCRDAAIIALLAYAGLRRSEIASVKVADYSRRSGQLIIREGKGQRQRKLVLPTAARTWLRRWLHERGAGPGPLFCRLTKNGECDYKLRLNGQQVYGLLRRRSRAAGIAPSSPHDLRRTFVTRLLEQGVDVNTARQLAGHEQLQTTALYDRRHLKSQRQALANFRF
ncbi:Integrase family protein [Candidatus Methylobacter favarea]|uniref:Integrase family protein n=1 Tax=Candidatus Methylobacter favarea TaxID=2707345 RepID=A0A8S0XTU2_9GAMM|nr:tyrosine-type recombinase/integrase [Candidatus Methylobacter favarea]CAA9891988.1 Integrase family protein [Candidatus Methylobacter favarea]